MERSSSSPPLPPLRALLADDGISSFFEVDLPVRHWDFLVRCERIPEKDEHGTQTFTLPRRSMASPDQMLRENLLLHSAGLAHQEGFAEVAARFLGDLLGQLRWEEQTLFFTDRRENITDLRTETEDKMANEEMRQVLGAL